MFSYKMLLVCLMLVHCILSVPASNAKDQGADMDTDEHRSRYYGGYGGYYNRGYYRPSYYGGYGGYGSYGGYGGYGGHGGYRGYGNYWG